MGKQRGDVDELLEGARSQHAGAAEEGFDGSVGAGERSGVGACRARARAGRARLQREQRLPARDPACDTAELVRVSERLEIEKYEVGALVLCPPLEQVVGRDVRLV